MAQFDFGNLVSPLSGQEFIDDNLEPWRDALHSLHSGTARPSYAVAGMMWLDTTTTPWVLNAYDGTDDIALGTINASTNAFTPSIALFSQLDNAFEIKDNSDPTKKFVFQASSITAGQTRVLTVQDLDMILAGKDIVQSFTKAQIGTPVSLTSTSNSTAIDLSLSNNFEHAFTENTTFADPTNMVAGQGGQIKLTQNASTPYTIAFGSKWVELTTGVAGTVSTTLSAKNLLTYYVADTSTIFYTLNKHGVT